MSDINTATVSGRVGKAELNERGNRLSIRLGSNYYAGKDVGDKTHWFTVIVFGTRASSLFEKLVIGSQILVAAVMMQREYTNRDGVTVRTFELHATEVVMGARPLEGGRRQ